MRKLLSYVERLTDFELVEFYRLHRVPAVLRELLSRSLTPVLMSRVVELRDEATTRPRPNTSS